jgi:hypothetical protein
MAQKVLVQLVDDLDGTSSQKRGTRPAQSGKSGNSGEAGQIREWALENGFELAGRGRIPSHVVEAYKEAQAEAKQAKSGAKPAAKRRTRAKKS